MYFERAGEENTEQTLRLAVEEALSRKIEHLVVASTFGDTGLKAARVAQGTGLKLVVVSHNTGFSEPGEQQFDPQVKTQIEDLGGIVFTGPMVFRGLGTVIMNKGGYSEEQIVADTLRMFGQGMKVCVEIVAMAADAGIIPCEDVVAVAGTARGSDTAVVIGANSSNHLFDIRIREILAKPRVF